MKGIGYFQNLSKFLRNCLEIFWIFLEFIWNYFGIFLEEFLGTQFWEDFFGRIFGIDLCVKILVFVKTFISMEKEGRTRNLDP